MLKTVRNIHNIIKNTFNNDNINKSSTVKIRQRVNGINPLNVIGYRFLYAHKDNTQERSVALINDEQKTNFSYQAFVKKDKNIPLEIYKQLYQDILLATADKTKTSYPLIAVDGVNNNIAFKVNLNMGFYDISNQIPIDISYLGSNNRNGEVKAFKSIIQKNQDLFKNAIFVCDRLYFDYSLIDYLNQNKYHYIIRVRGNGNKLDLKSPLKKGPVKYDTIKRIRDNGIRIIKNSFISREKVEVGKRNKKTIISINKKNECIYATNLPNCYNDKNIHDSYKSRWDIEVFFKLIKNNFKFSTFIKNNTVQIEKGYICQLTIAQIICAITKSVMSKMKTNKSYIKKKNGKKIKCTVTINKSHLISRLYDTFIHKLFTGFTDDEFNTFIKGSIKIIKNETGRAYPRIAKTPFKKWYLKGQSICSQLKRICNAIIDGTIDKLNKNLRLIAHKIDIIK